MTQNVIIIGAGAVGMTVATFLSRHTDHHIRVFSSDTHTAYSQCGMPFALGSHLFNLTDLIVKPLNVFIDMGIDLHLKTKVNNINVNSQKVVTKDGIFTYDFLVIATGSTPFIPPIPGNDLDGVYTLHTLSDGMNIEKALKNSTTAAIIGAGSKGSELAACLIKRGIKVTLIQSTSQVLPSILDPDMALIVRQHLISKGIRVITGTRVDRINPNESTRVGSVTVGDELLPADIVIITTGVKPLVDLAMDAGFDIDPAGGIVTDTYLRVKFNGKFLNNIYAGGECAQVNHLITNSPILIHSGAAARRMARVIGKNITRKTSTLSTYPPTLHPNVVAMEGLTAGSVGITSQTASKHDIYVISGTSKGYTKAGYYPGASPLYIKLIFSDTRLVGAQVVAAEGVKERIDALSLAIRMGAVIDDLLRWETSYAPPVSMVIDPVTLAAEDRQKKMWK
jgi:NADH oxidase (H2O2-forming)